MNTFLKTYKILFNDLQSEDIKTANEYIHNVIPKFKLLSKTGEIEIYIIKDLLSELSFKKMTRYLQIISGNYISILPNTKFDTHCLFGGGEYETINNIEKWKNYDKTFETEYQKQLDRYKQGYNKGYDAKISSTITGNNLSKSLNEHLHKLDLSLWIKGNENKVIKLVDTGSEAFNEIDLYEHGKGIGKYVKRWETLLEPFNIDAEEDDDLDKNKYERNKQFNPEQFNNFTFNLYNHIIKDYTKKGKIKYINVWYFLKRDYKHESLMFNFTQDKYIDYVKKYHKVDIKKFAKSEYDYADNQIGVLQNISKGYIPV